MFMHMTDHRVELVHGIFRADHDNSRQSFILIIIQEKQNHASWGVESKLVEFSGKSK